ncbi:hypothetical protein D9758_000601 [Tetrapyrgos nigripes]|uniref:Methyltransferase n=1 Tax=Tetrapyrgos nigripes TaxID=182062 RepID=A0A8H5GYY4_9AGAR|nr:hypothetical protein D9758_000601 [Tetrapyrgos nigripes]
MQNFPPSSYGSLTTLLLPPLSVLDLGTGAGLWAISMADEFPRAEVIGIDLAPLQPRFELCDVNQGSIPYPDSYFDLIHARSMHTGISDYPRMIREIARLLRPGGLVLLVEPSLHPYVDGERLRLSTDATSSTSNAPNGGGGHPIEIGNADNWYSFWETYRACLTRLEIDITVPERIAEMLLSIGSFEDIIQRDGNIPVGFWPTGVSYA